jgi:hypothetical protein
MYPQEPVFEATAFEIRLKLSMDMSRQSLLRPMAFAGGVTKGILAWWLIPQHHNLTSRQTALFCS